MKQKWNGKIKSKIYRTKNIIDKNLKKKLKKKSGQKIDMQRNFHFKNVRKLKNLHRCNAKHMNVCKIKREKPCKIVIFLLPE